jgi:hypothetical protein
VGEWVLIHVGFAMSKVSASDELDQLRVLMTRRKPTQPWKRSAACGLGEPKTRQGP